MSDGKIIVVKKKKVQAHGHHGGSWKVAYADFVMPVGPTVVSTVSDAMPGFGIVAAVLGIIITMGNIGGSPEAVGQSVGAALVGTFLGILLAYGVLSPISHAMLNRVEAEQR